MARTKELQKISALAGLVLDHRLGQMRLAADQVARSQTQLAAIDQGEAPSDLPLVAAAVVATDYRRWADVRRIELNAVLARQKAALLATRAEAELAFGRVQALNALSSRKGPRN
jgi:hypothetical protein